MQITKAEVTPVDLKLHHPVRLAGLEPITQVTAIFIRLLTRSGQSAWGVTIAHPDLTGDQPEEVLRLCQQCAAQVADLHPTNIEFSLAQLGPTANQHPAVLCAFDLALHDLLSLATGLPLYRLLGGFRDRIQTSITIPLSSVEESVDLAEKYASDGFRILKIKGGGDSDLDVQRIKAIHRALPEITLRLDADGGYTVRTALEVARALQGRIEVLEQPTPPGDLGALADVTRSSLVPVLADQSACGPASALQIAAGRSAHGLSVKLAACGGLRAARQVDAIARAAHLDTTVSCLIEPAMLTAAGLSFALSSPNVRFGDLDGYLHLANAPSLPGFKLEEGWLIAADVVGLGYSVNL
jgi:L-Ala-D/L-Glu epimerase